MTLTMLREYQKELEYYKFRSETWAFASCEANGRSFYRLFGSRTIHFQSQATSMLKKQNMH